MSPPSFEWHPVALLRERRPEYPGPADFTLIVLNQPVKHTPVFDSLWTNALTRVAADGGANRLHDLSKAAEARSHSPFTNLDVIIGDLDSLLPPVRDYYTSLEKPAQVIHDSDQYSTDFGKAVSWIRSNHEPAIDIVALGGLGGRVDQGLSQVHHLYLFQPGTDYAHGKLYLVSGQSLTFLLKPGHHSIWVREGGDDVFGKHVGIIPIGGTSYITTKGLEWDVEDWETKFGGHISTSNHVLPETTVVEIATTNTVLFTIALAGIE
ncbi:thiamine pyrophosphokinase [Colletotrichum higginsianum]|uniref:Thiamine pyrophosphokinase n=2 Tax=Colletotrichum higginsianum TaxID=80884 RepID=H1VZP9_COLHI|nr:Thiamine pyrophosphokinase [Colletotrichum higginsianum IMI 349063]OBR12997.1 Thiamine pyrophosphokinase [Colletotrichum higginsianum IMI 349063]TIC99385.1 Thiamine pyrophosphokinase 3 [Colletotrichum higginsianum]GJC94672.1 thiamine pyrophosphokinase [Colletotrichum higginsianum]CCF45711.1 thiamine pyrophosphokinase [Colletotrichum higginsianum]